MKQNDGKAGMRTKPSLLWFERELWLGPATMLGAAACAPASVSSNDEAATETSANLSAASQKANLVLAANADPSERKATVGMIYYPSGTDRIVSFFAYPPDPSAQRVPDADLDGFGPKPIPQLCTVCHGGRYVPPDLLNPSYSNASGHDDSVLGSKFREFDPETYLFPTAQQTTTSTPSAADLSALAGLNRVARYVAEQYAFNDPIAETIETWYPNGFSSSQFQREAVDLVHARFVRALPKDVPHVPRGVRLDQDDRVDRREVELSGRARL